MGMPRSTSAQEPRDWLNDPQGPSHPGSRDSMNHLLPPLLLESAHLTSMYNCFLTFANMSKSSYFHP